MFGPGISNKTRQKMYNWDWDSVYLSPDGQTNFIEAAIDSYSFDECHDFVAEFGWGMDLVVAGGCMPEILAYHYGKLSKTACFYRKALSLFVDRLLQRPFEKVADTAYCLIYWLPFALCTNQIDPLCTAMEKVGLTWTDGHLVIDQAQTVLAFFDKGLALLLLKLSYVMAGGAEKEGVAEEEIIAAIPSWDKYVELLNGNLGGCVCHCDWLPLLASIFASALERACMKQVCCTHCTQASILLLQLQRFQYLRSCGGRV
eukprot:COSAG02_NODE_13615_length_1372_cov_1.279654_2_plen_258_part_00